MGKQRNKKKARRQLRAANAVAQRPRLLEAKARELRKEAGFGCCICGLPFVVYHHIEGWEVSGDDVTRMMAVCANCHGRATANAFPKGDQYKAKAAPFNIQRGLATGPLFVGEQPIVVVLGSNEFVGEGQKLLVDDHVLLALERNLDGGLLVSFDLFSAKNDLLVSVVRNEWVTGDPLPWDFEYKYNWFRLRQKLGVVAVEVDASVSPIKLRGAFWRNGVLFRASEDVLSAGQGGRLQMRNMAYVNFSVHLYSDGRVTVGPEPGMGTGAMISEPNQTVRLRKALEAVARLRNGK